MTALTVPARPEQDASLRPVPWRRMAWVTWRQHRIALAGVAALLGALAVCLWLAGLQAAPRLRRRGRLPPGELGCLRDHGRPASMARTASWRMASYCRRCRC